MRITYGLKTSQKATFVEPLVKHLEQNYDIQTAYTFKGLLEKINELRSRATSLTMRPDGAPEDIDKNIEMLSAYTRYALVILNRFNWDSQRGKAVEGMQLSWFDSFQPKLQFHRHSISFDVFCCYYNLSVMYLTRAIKQAEVELDSARKQAVSKAKAAAFLLRQMKERFYKQFVQCGFHDTQFPHLDIMENICMGLIYRCTFDNFKESEYKIGISKIAAICGLAAKNFFKAYTVASTFFMSPSGISDKTKTEILAYTYFSSLYLDVMTNTRYAKHYANEMEKDPSMIVITIAYERKAMRLLEIGLKNPSVEMLFNQNPKQKAQLVRVQEQLRESLVKNVMRNKQIYKQREIAQANIPPPDDLPQQYIVKLDRPANLVMENQGEFAQLMSEQSYALAQQLIQFSNSKKMALQTSIKKLQQEIDKAYNDCYVNFYLQMVSDAKRSIPKAIQEKLHNVRKQGGKQKILQEIQKLTDNQKMGNASFMQLRQQLNNQEYTDMQKRNQYGPLWTRKPSPQANQQYTTALNNLEGKFKTAMGVDAKIFDKFNKNKAYVETLNSSDEEILNILPKPQQSQFAETYKGELAKLKQKSESVRKRKDYVIELSLQIIDYFGKINYPLAANKYLADKLKRQDVFRTIFGESESHITKFNAEVHIHLMKCVNVKSDVQAASTIAVSLNSKNKQSDGKAKRQFEVVVASYNEIGQIFKDCSLAMVFYDKLNTHLAKLTADVEDYVYGRSQSTKQLEASINSKKGGMGGMGGGGGFQNPLPEMYPGQRKDPVPEFVPPPIPPSLFDQGQVMWGPEKQGFNVFEGGMGTKQGPSFPPAFSGPVYSEFMQQPPQEPLQFPSNPFAGQVFKSQVVKK